MAGPYTLTGQGVQTIATPRGLKIEVLAPGLSMASGQANPRNLFHVGLLRWGTSNGYFPPVPIDADTQQLSLPRGMTSLGYNLGPGAQIRVTETAGVLDSLYDRKIADVVQSFGVSAAPVGTTRGFSYTVPTGQRLAIAQLQVSAARISAASSVNGSYCIAYINGADALMARWWSNTAGSIVQEWAPHGGLIAVESAGTVEIVYANTDTGGQIEFRGHLLGFTFA